MELIDNNGAHAGVYIYDQTHQKVWPVFLIPPQPPLARHTFANPHLPHTSSGNVVTGVPTSILTNVINEVNYL